MFDGPGYDDAIIGISHDGRAVYDYNKMVMCLVEQDGMEIAEAEEFIDYNAIRSLPYYKAGPIVITPLEEE